MRYQRGTKDGTFEVYLDWRTWGLPLHLSWGPLPWFDYWHITLGPLHIGWFRLL